MIKHDWAYTATGSNSGGLERVVFHCRACGIALAVLRAAQFLPRSSDSTPGPSDEEYRVATRPRSGWTFFHDCGLEQARLVTSE